MEKRDIFIGGAWPYANYYLHIGHFAALLPGDIIAKYYRGNGDNVIYVSGSDCHGTPITERAIKENVSPEEIAIESDKIKLEGYTTINGSFKIDTNGNFEAIGGKIGGISIDSNGLFYSGSNSNDGFGLWKNNVHWDGSGYIIFHAGGNSANIGGSPFRIYQNGRFIILII